MDDFQPFLQIVHISDLHVMAGGSKAADKVREWVRRIGYFSDSLAHYVSEGTAPHDPLAVPLFKDFLSELTADQTWKNCETWLIDTGDLTSLGDQKSLDTGQAHLNEFRKVCPKSATIHGNHDGWPGTFPLFAKPFPLKTQRTELAKRTYAIGTPSCPLKLAIPHAGGEVQLYLTDSVIIDRWKNTWALGEVPEAQLTALETLIDGNYRATRHDFRILAVHHPVHYPPPRPSREMVMNNDTRVGTFLDTARPAGTYPLAHLVLSGHTHALFPALGQLPVQTTLCNHTPLGIQQCQLVAGTLMQLDRYGKRGAWPHQCEVLRLYYSESKPRVLFMERLLAARQSGAAYRGAGIGPYKFVLANAAKGQVEEQITFVV